MFIKKFRHVVGNNVFALVLDALNNGVNPSFLNHTHITLIPKIKHSLFPRYIGPISLCNVIFKIIIKVIANRLKFILRQIIHET